MNIKRIIVAMLLVSGLTMGAKNTPLFKKGGTKVDSEKITELTFKRKHQPRDYFKFGTGAIGSASGSDWDESKVSGSGFFLNLGIHFIPTTYLNNDYKSGDIRFKTGYDFELGNFFRFAKFNDDKLGIGLRVTWLSLGYAKTTDDKDIYRVAQICPLKVGPEFAIAFNETMGLDLFYQLGYNLTENFGSIDSPSNSKKIGASWTYQGISHEVGAAFHFKIFSLGLGYRFGSLKNTMFVYDGKKMDSDFLQKGKVSINNFMITLGLRF